MTRQITLLGGACWLASLLTITGVAHAQAPAPAPAAPTTIWNFLGIQQACKFAKTNLVNRNGNLPCLEPKALLKPIADPANLAEGNPKIIQKAAEIKQQEDMAKQKVKALKYLASMGCGCYKGVDEALMEALDDCTEEVRYETARAVSKAAGYACSNCRKKGCCTKALFDKMSKLAFERNDDGCWKEPSDRVRLALQEALQLCCCYGIEGVPAEAAGGQTPILDSPRPAPSNTEPDPAPAPPESRLLPLNPTPQPENRQRVGDGPESDEPAAPEPGTNPATGQTEALDPSAGGAAPIWVGDSAPSDRPQLQRTTWTPVPVPAETSPAPATVRRVAVPRTCKGKVVQVDPASHLVGLSIPENERPLVGTVVRVERHFLMGHAAIGTLEFVGQEDGVTLARAHDVRQPLRKGDIVTLFVETAR